jgi:hypothetical protein
MIAQRNALEWKRLWVNNFVTSGFFFEVNHHYQGPEVTYLMRANLDDCVKTSKLAQNTFHCGYPCHIPATEVKQVSGDIAAKVIREIFDENRLTLNTFTGAYYWREVLPDNLKKLIESGDTRWQKVPGFTKPFLFRLKTFILGFTYWINHNHDNNGASIVYEHLELKVEGEDIPVYNSEDDDDEDDENQVVYGNYDHNCVSVKFKDQVIFTLSYHSSCV